MLYYFRYALAVNVEPSVLSQWRSATFFSGLFKSSVALFFQSLKLHIELSEIHRSRNGVLKHAV